jgi:SAM-dependent methyltransferase
MYPDAATRFSDRAEAYARFRPSYPREIVDALLDGFAAPVVADLGAGTGISAALLAAAGARVYAIEPNAAMRAAIVTGQRIEAREGTAESTGLPARSVDVIAAFQAYHWFDAPAVMAEAARIARPRARFAAVWNERDLEHPFSAAYEAAIAPYDTTGGALHRDRRSGRVLADGGARLDADARSRCKARSSARLGCARRLRALGVVSAARRPGSRSAAARSAGGVGPAAAGEAARLRLGDARVYRRAPS